MCRGAERIGRGCSEEGGFSSGGSRTRITDIAREKGGVEVRWTGGGVGMDFGGSDPRLGAFGKVWDGGAFEVARGMTYADLWLSEESTGGDDAGQEGEERRIGTR